MQLVNEHRAVKVRLVEPTDSGYLLLTSHVGGWIGPFARPSCRVRRLVSRVANLSEELTAHPDVVGATTFRGVLRPPGEGSTILRRHGISPVRHDVVVLVRTRTVGAINSVGSDGRFRNLASALQDGARHSGLVTASNAARIADVDHRPNAWFLFNFFHADDTPTLLDTWEYTAGWFQRKTSLENSALMLPLAHQAGAASVINHASWPTLGRFLPSLLFRPTFRSFVLANFKANQIAAQPIIYRRIVTRANGPEGMMPGVDDDEDSRPPDDHTFMRTRHLPPIRT